MCSILLKLIDVVWQHQHIDKNIPIAGVEAPETNSRNLKKIKNRVVVALSYHNRKIIIGNDDWFFMFWTND